MLCTELPTSRTAGRSTERGPDGKHGVALTYTIQPDATWGDGTPVTTEDVLFTWEVGRHPKSGVGNAELYRRIWRIDRRRQDLHAARREARLQLQRHQRLPAAAGASRAPGVRGGSRPPTATAPVRHRADQPGPRLRALPDRARCRPAARSCSSRNPTWWGEPPAFERIVIKAIENTAALEANLLSGEIDMIEGSARPVARSGAGLRAPPWRPIPGRLQARARSTSTSTSCSTTRSSPTVRVRQALLYGLDRAAISQQLFAGRQPVADTPRQPAGLGPHRRRAALPLRPGRGRSLLDEAGWTARRRRAARATRRASRCGSS